MGEYLGNMDLARKGRAVGLYRRLFRFLKFEGFFRMLFQGT